MKRLSFFIGFVFCFILSGYSQVTFVITDFPDDTAKNAKIFITGDFEGWTGGQEKYELLQEENSYSITIPKQSATINFKFTLGTWNSAEGGIDGNSIENRSYEFKENEEIQKLIIASWSKPTPKKSTASINVSILSENFYIPQLDRERRIWLYLPPDYEISDKNYPVIYMHDGQNLFDSSTSYSGEWEVDETLDKLYKKNGFSAIVVGIDNGETKRLDEYSPWVNSNYGGGEGDSYLEFIVETLKPFVDKTYRTKPEKNSTAIIGSSMGGLISYYAGLKYSEVFGKIGIYSPAFWFSPEINEYAKLRGNIQDTKMYFLAGGKEGVGNTEFSEINETAKGIITISNIQFEQGFSKDDTFIKVVPEGKHNEKMWRENFEETLLWLFHN